MHFVLGQVLLARKPHLVAFGSCAIYTKRTARPLWT